MFKRDREKKDSVCEREREKRERKREGGRVRRREEMIKL